MKSEHGTGGGPHKGPAFVDDDPGWIVTRLVVVQQHRHDGHARYKGSRFELQNASAVPTCALRCHHQHREAPVLCSAGLHLSDINLVLACGWSDKLRLFLRRLLADTSSLVLRQLQWHADHCVMRVCKNLCTSCGRCAESCAVRLQNACSLSGNVMDMPYGPAAMHASACKEHTAAGAPRAKHQQAACSTAQHSTAQSHLSAMACDTDLPLMVGVLAALPRGT